MNHNFPNIEIINFDSMTNENDHYYDHRDIEMDYLNNFLLERFESEYDNQNDNVLIADTQSQITFLSEVDMPTMKTPVNSSSCRNGDSLSCYSEGTKSTSNTSPLETPAEAPEKPFRCSYDNCKKSFKFKWILDRHYLSHKSVKQYKCTYRGCPKSYKSKENLTLHVKNIHLKEKPYSCRFCTSVFSHRNGKTYHERKFHTNYLPHKCPINECNCNFASKSALTYHLKSQHSDKSPKKSGKMNRSKFNQEILKIVNEFDVNDTSINNCNECSNEYHLPYQHKL